MIQCEDNHTDLSDLMEEFKKFQSKMIKSE